MVVVYDHTVQEHHFFSSGTLMASTCDLLGTKMGAKQPNVPRSAEAAERADQRAESRRRARDMRI